MKQVIGFTEKFYTLWTYEAEKVATGQHSGYIKHNWNYIQNLSFDLEKAKSKFPNAEIDLQQKGNKSFSTIENYDNTPDEVMWFGQHKGALIAEIPEKYIVWLLEKCDNKPRIIKNSLIAQRIMMNNEAAEIAEEKRISEIPVLHNETELEVIFEKNLQIVGDYIYNKETEDEDFVPTHAAYSFELNGLSVCLLFEDYAEMYYNGYSYALPKLKGSAKRIKGKTLKLKITQEGDIEVSKSEKLQTFLVKSFEILK